MQVQAINPKILHDDVGGLAAPNRLALPTSHRKRKRQAAIMPPDKLAKSAEGDWLTSELSGYQ
jgi:hypothetical protein